MPNNWKYGTLSRRERVALIDEGNTDVYNAEKANNAALMKQYKQDGVDTSDIEAWDASVDRRYNKALLRKAHDQAVHFSNVPQSVMNLITQLSSQYVKNRNFAIKNAQEAKNYLNEWLANNGLSDQTESAKKKLKDIETGLANTLSSLEENYRNSVSQISY